MQARATVRIKAAGRARQRRGAGENDCHCTCSSCIQDCHNLAGRHSSPSRLRRQQHLPAGWRCRLCHRRSGQPASPAWGATPLGSRPASQGRCQGQPGSVEPQVRARRSCRGMAGSGHGGWAAAAGATWTADRCGGAVCRHAAKHPVLHCNLSASCAPGRHRAAPATRGAAPYCVTCSGEHILR